MIGLIDYGLSNIRSVQKAFDHLGVPTQLIHHPDALWQFDRLVLPGVGAFAPGMAGLAKHHLIEGIRDVVASGTPLLGICLGMQLLFEWSQEDGFHQGLGLLKGRVVPFPDLELVIPHMGWNQLQIQQSVPLLSGIESGDYAYFVHSYICQPNNASQVLAKTDYGIAFAAIVGSGHVYGMQFHPEKSQHVGLRILRNYSQL